MKMSGVSTSLTAACIAAFGANVLVKRGTSVPDTTGEGATLAPSQIIIGARSGATLRHASAAAIRLARDLLIFRGRAVSATS